LLVPKARQALDRYGHQLVIGNMLNTRKWLVVLVDQHNEHEIRLSKEQLNQGVEIEEQIIKKLVEQHSEHIIKYQ
jgi:phosphopantothenate-cysteine ligase